MLAMCVFKVSGGFKGTAIYYPKLVKKSMVPCRYAPARTATFRNDAGGVYLLHMQFWIGVLVAAYLVYLGFH
jgi:hypothetical protein